MALSLHEYLYRFRAQFALNGELVLAETVKKAVSVDSDGNTFMQGDSEVRTISAEKIRPELEALLARFNAVFEEEKIEKAEREAEEARKAAEAAAAASASPGDGGGDE